MLWNRNTTRPRASPDRGRRKAPAHDRRAAPRHRPVRDAVLVGWWTGDGHFATVPAKVADLSQGGARLEIATIPEGLQAGASLWVRPDPGDEAEWCEARLVAAERGSSRGAALRIAFPGNCRYDLYVTLLYGQPVGGHPWSHCVDPNFEDTRYWR